MIAMPRRSETSESTQLGLFEQGQPHVELSPTSRQQLAVLIENPDDRNRLGARNRGGRR